MARACACVLKATAALGDGTVKPSETTGVQYGQGGEGGWVYMRTTKNYKKNRAASAIVCLSSHTTNE